MRRDRFAEVMGTRRGTGDAGRHDLAWWAWGLPHYQRLAEWLDHVAGAGYVELVVISRGALPSFELRAYRRDRAAGHAALIVDDGEALWLEDHWPSELIDHRDDDRVRGRLHSATPAVRSS